MLPKSTLFLLYQIPLVFPLWKRGKAILIPPFIKGGRGDFCTDRSVYAPQIYFIPSISNPPCVPPLKNGERHLNPPFHKGGEGGFPHRQECLCSSSTFLPLSSLKSPLYSPFGKGGKTLTSPLSARQSSTVPTQNNRTNRIAHR